jgi:exodeoxyribonuclease VIII
MDWLAPGVIVDLKTTVHAGQEFAHSVRKYRYHLQAAMYSRIAQLCGIDNCAFIFVAVERDFPYGVGVYELSQEDMDNGLNLYYGLTRRLVECEDTNQWPGYTTGVETLKAFTR